MEFGKKLAPGAHSRTSGYRDYFYRGRHRKARPQGQLITLVAATALVTPTAYPALGDVLAPGSTSTSAPNASGAGERPAEPRLAPEVEPASDAESAAQELAEAEEVRSSRQQAEREQAEREQAEREQAEQEQAEREAVEREQAEQEQAEREQAEREQAEREQAEQEQAEQEQAEQEQAEQEQAEQEQAEQQAPAQESSSQEGSSQSGQFVKPAEGTFTSGFGARWGSAHNGVDIANAIGTPIVAVTDGEVIEAGSASGFGLWVRLRHDDGTVTVYGHMNEILVSEGQRVSAGEDIATIGNRGNSTGPHLHFEVWQNGGDKIDPKPWLAERGISLS